MGARTLRGKPGADKRSSRLVLKHFPHHGSVARKKRVRNRYRPAVLKILSLFARGTIHIHFLNAVLKRVFAQLPNLFRALVRPLVTTEFLKRIMSYPHSDASFVEVCALFRRNFEVPERLVIESLVFVLSARKRKRIAVVAAAAKRIFYISVVVKLFSRHDRDFTSLSAADRKLGISHAFAAEIEQDRIAAATDGNGLFLVIRKVLNGRGHKRIIGVLALLRVNPAFRGIIFLHKAVFGRTEIVIFFELCIVSRHFRLKITAVRGAQKALVGNKRGFAVRFKLQPQACTHIAAYGNAVKHSVIIGMHGNSVDAFTKIFRDVDGIVILTEIIPRHGPRQHEIAVDV